MAGSLTVRQARLVLPDRVVVGDLVVEDGIITEIAPRVGRTVGLQVDGRGCTVLPGVVDTHVRLDACEDLASMSVAALAGGVTTVLGVRNAETRAELRAELAAGADIAQVHFGLYLRATRDNLDEIQASERPRAIWVAGDILTSDQAEVLFANTDRIMVVDNVDPKRLAKRGDLYTEALEPAQHPKIHDVDSAVSATRAAIDLARKHGRHTHLLHVSTAEEVELLRAERPESLTAAARTPHLFLGAEAYPRLGTRAVTSPPIRQSPRHQEALWAALADGTLDLVSSGHLPVRAESKDRPYPHTHPGMPSIEWTLPLLLDRVAAGLLTLSEVARWTAEVPATTMRLARKGRLETGYDGDLVLVDLELTRTVGQEAPIRTESGWSPWQGRTLTGWPVLTVLLGEPVYRDGEVLPEPRGRSL